MTFPLLTLRLESIRNNARTLVKYCADRNIEIAGVTKFSSSDIRVAGAMLQGGVSQLATSRIEQLEKLRMAFADATLIMLRMPMHSEVDKVVQWSDISVQSELSTLELLNEAAQRVGKTHGVLLMYDVGDLREGVFTEEKLLRLASRAEELNYLKLEGVGSSFACFGSVLPDKENLNRLAVAAEKIEAHIGRTLDIVSGGSSISLPVLRDSLMPSKINHLRLGGFLVNPRTARIRRNFTLEGMKEDTFSLSAEVIEVQEKPSLPVGAMSINWRGQKKIFEDKGIRKRAIVALGSQDVMDPCGMTPELSGAQIIGSSSDHTVIDVTDCDRTVSPGDILHFYLLYEHLLFAFNSQSIQKVYLEESEG